MSEQSWINHDKMTPYPKIRFNAEQWRRQFQRAIKKAPTDIEGANKELDALITEAEEALR